MPKYGYWLTEKTTVYKEIEAEDRDQANELIDEFMWSDQMDWGIGKMEVNYEFDGEIKMNQFDMSFVHNGIHIMNPTLSEDGRFSVSPSHYGFGIEQTGGGSTAWVKYLDNGVLVLTNEDGISHNLDNGFMLGFYDGDENEGTWGNCLGILEADKIV